MKFATILLLGIVFFGSCGNNQSDTMVNTDSSTVNSNTSASDTLIVSKGVTGTTGTGTVSDSGNAANAYTGIKTDSVNNTQRSTSVNGTDTIKR